MDIPLPTKAAPPSGTFDSKSLPLPQPDNLNNAVVNFTMVAVSLPAPREFLNLGEARASALRTVATPAILARTFITFTPVIGPGI